MANEEQIQSFRKQVRSYLMEGSYSWEGLSKDNNYNSIYLIVAQECNAKCSYCYQPDVFRKKSVMTKEVADTAVKFMNKTIGNRARFHLFGGEPLLNFDVVRYIVDKYPQVMFSMTTNGIVIDESVEVQEWIKSHRHHLDLTVSCSAQREFYGKDKYLKKIQPCIDIVKTNGGEFHFVVADPFDTDLFSEIKYFFDSGVKMKISAANCGKIIATDEGLNAYVSLLKKVVDYLYFDDKPKFDISTYDRVFKGSMAKKRKGTLDADAMSSLFCGCGHTYLAVTPTGDIYPCDYFSSFPEMKIGDIYGGMNNDAKFFTNMDEWTTTLYDCCKGCEIEDLRLCTRAHCLAENYEFNKHPFEPTKSHCNTNILEYRLFNYVLDEAEKRNMNITKLVPYKSRSLP